MFCNVVNCCLNVFRVDIVSVMYFTISSSCGIAPGALLGAPLWFFGCASLVDDCPTLLSLLWRFCCVPVPELRGSELFCTCDSNKRTRSMSLFSVNVCGYCLVFEA